MEDKQLIDKILVSGSTDCYKTVVERYSAMVYSKVLGIVRRSDLAGELTQQTFIRAYTRLDTFRGESLAPWLTTIALHLSLNTMQKERRSHHVDVSKADAIEREEYSEEREQMLASMENAMSRLPDIDREILRLHYYKGRKTAEIARTLGLTESNVLVKLHRIREKLRKELQYERDR